MHHGHCSKCGKWEYLQPLHGERGGPMFCLLCFGAWHGEHGRRRKWGRLLMRVLEGYFAAGGTPADVDKLKRAAGFRNLKKWFVVPAEDVDPLGYLGDIAESDGESIELTSELLTDAIKLAHPDLHPPERHELANRVTRGLLALKPYTFPAPKPKPNPPREAHAPTEPTTTETQAPTEAAAEPVIKPPFPCRDCADSRPLYYCNTCKAEWESRQREKAERKRAKVREQYKRRKERRDRLKPAPICASCSKSFKGRRADARFCSATCRQRAHRAVTHKNLLATIIKASVTPAS
jgi:hypothetical protein